MPKEFELCSSHSTFYAIIENKSITVVTNRGDFSFDLYELIELIADVLILGETKPSFYKNEHAYVSYKLPIVCWLLYLNGEKTISLSRQKLRVTLESNIELKEGRDVKSFIKKLDRIQPPQYDSSGENKVQESYKSYDMDYLDFKHVDESKKSQSQKIKEKSYKVEINFVTPREKVQSNEIFSSNRAGKLSYGRAELSIPTIHVDGRVERPSLFSKALKIFSRDTEAPSKYIVIRDIKNTTESQFLSGINSSSSVLIFIHGYNVSFTDALHQSAQLKFDLAYPGEFILYSWPSKGKVIGYVGDKERAVRAGADLARLIDKISNSDVENVYLLAHSMGTYCLSEAVNYINQSGFKDKIRIALAAPDIDSEDFKSHYAKKYLNNSNGVSVYACNRDRALLISKLVHGSDRLGYSNPITLVDGVDTIDATPLTSGLPKKLKLNHSYIFQHSYLITDLHNYFFHKNAAKDRRLKAIPDKDTPAYWELHRC